MHIVNSGLGHMFDVLIFLIFRNKLYKTLNLQPFMLLKNFTTTSWLKPLFVSAPNLTLQTKQKQKKWKKCICSQFSTFLLIILKENLVHENRWEKHCWTQYVSVLLHCQTWKGHGLRSLHWYEWGLCPPLLSHRNLLELSITLPRSSLLWEDPLYPHEPLLCLANVLLHHCSLSCQSPAETKVFRVCCLCNIRVLCFDSWVLLLKCRKWK